MRTPVLFIGHGSPMNIIENNIWVRVWRQLGKELPRQMKIKGIAMISAHWYTNATYVTGQDKPEMVYDMYGFPELLYDIKYPAKNDPALRDRVMEVLDGIGELNEDWGYDHGNYSVLYNMFPKANIPVLQISINALADARYHFEVGKRLKELRDEGILIIGSGNIVHNLGLMSVTRDYDWAERFDNRVKDLVIKKDYKNLMMLDRIDEDYKLAVPTPDHLYPLMVCLGATDEDEKIQIANDEIFAASISMTSIFWGIQIPLK